MRREFKEALLQKTNASELREIEKIQDLWSGYGTIKRYALCGSEIPSIIAKHVRPPSAQPHPRGWNSNLSHERKVTSYSVELEWYTKWSIQCSKGCYVPECYLAMKLGNEFFIALEDLDASGFSLRKSSVSLTEIKNCLKWLAHFHAAFLGKEPGKLWETGTYWHLDTRPDELAKLKDKQLRGAAKAIDEKLASTEFRTIVHGDAKLANFCFSKDHSRVAAVDFQYVGGGCGMKDVAYFIGSCLDEKDCEKYEAELLNYYFSVLQSSILSRKMDIDVAALVRDWRELFPVAWADFHRFIKGWSPGHWKINSYSERITKSVIEAL